MNRLRFRFPWSRSFKIIGINFMIIVITLFPKFFLSICLCESDLEEPCCFIPVGLGSFKIIGNNFMIIVITCGLTWERPCSSLVYQKLRKGREVPIWEFPVTGMFGGIPWWGALTKHYRYSVIKPCLARWAIQGYNLSEVRKSRKGNFRLSRIQ